MSDAPRITPLALELVIASEHYFTAADAVHYNAGGPMVAPPPQLELLTFCVLVLNNGFTVTGESACVSAANFNAERGCEVARENAISKMWALEGYLLKQRLHDAGVE